MQTENAAKSTVSAVILPRDCTGLALPRAAAWAAAAGRSWSTEAQYRRVGDASFDAIISMIVFHNVPSRQRRDEALRELVRVLKPGGRMVIFDRMHASRYAEVLRDAGMKVKTLSRDFLWLLPCRSLLAQKTGGPGSDTAALD